MSQIPQESNTWVHVSTESEHCVATDIFVIECPVLLMKKRTGSTTEG